MPLLLQQRNVESNNGLAFKITSAVVMATLSLSFNEARIVILIWSGPPMFGFFAAYIDYMLTLMFKQ